MTHITGKCKICNIQGMSCMEKESETCPNKRLMDVRESAAQSFAKNYTPPPVKQVRPEDFFTTE